MDDTRSIDTAREEIRTTRKVFETGDPHAIFYLVRGGCAWRMLPNDLPPWKLVWHDFAHWKKQGVWARLNDALRDAVRLQAGKKKPRPLRFSMRKACAQLSKAEFVDTMLARRWQDESDIFWSTPWD